MAEPYLGEIRMFAGDFAPVNWLICNGQALSIAQNQALFTLLGTIYGGDGITTFKIPDLQGRAPVSAGQGVGLTSRALGQASGTETVSLLQTNLPSHNHTLLPSANNATTSTASSSGILAAATDTTGGQIDGRYLPTGKAVKTTVQLNPLEVVNAGTSLPHENMMSSLAISFIIATAGVYPSQS